MWMPNSVGGTGRRVGRLRTSSLMSTSRRHRPAACRPPKVQAQEARHVALAEAASITTSCQVEPTSRPLQRRFVHGPERRSMTCTRTLSGERSRSGAVGVALLEGELLAEDEPGAGGMASLRCAARRRPGRSGGVRLSR